MSENDIHLPVVILNGFLGSGKTTLLRHLLSQCYQSQRKIGVVVNEMSTLDVDGQLVEATDFFEDDDRYFISISSGALSSPAGMQQLHNALAQIKQDADHSNSGPELLIIETSGSCHPLPLVEYFRDQSFFHLTGMLTLVDSVMLAQDFTRAEDLIPKLQHNLQHERRDMVNLLVEQIMFCSHLLLTKADKLADGDLQHIAGQIHQLNPYVAITSVPWGKLDLTEVLALPGYDYHRVGQLISEIKPALAAQATDQEPYNITSQVIIDDRPFHPQRLWETCNQFLGEKVFRSKGFFWLASRDQASLLWNQAAGSMSLELVGSWRAGILEDPSNVLDDHERAQLAAMVAEQAGRFGDRHCHLTVIGEATHVAIFSEALQACFLTEDEITQWQAGAVFVDPWPTTLKAT